jgi:hypothetical protein
MGEREKRVLHERAAATFVEASDFERFPNLLGSAGMEVEVLRGVLSCFA